MTDTAGPFDGAPWSEAQWARHAAMWAPSGVYGASAASSTTGDLPLSVSGLSVGLGAGRAWVRGFGFERTGAAVMQAVTANTHASFSRRDRIVLRRNLATHTISPVLLTGTPASSPVAPTLTQNEAGSWDAKTFSFLVPPNSGTSITGIVDEREWVTGPVRQVVRTGLNSAWVGTVYDGASPLIRQTFFAEPQISGGAGGWGQDFPQAFPNGILACSVTLAGLVTNTGAPQVVAWADRTASTLSRLNGAARSNFTGTAVPAGQFLALTVDAIGW